jgi:sec-independent protein translocase protein TatB
MELFGVGPLEFVLILVLALVILGPRDMVATARRMGQWIYRAVRSPTWRAIVETTQELRELPQKIVRDAGLEETMKEVTDTVKEARAELTQATNDAQRELSQVTKDVNQEMRQTAESAASEMQQAISNVNDGAQENFAQAAGRPLHAGIAPGMTMLASENIVWPEIDLANAHPDGEIVEDVIYNAGEGGPQTYEQRLDALSSGLLAGTSSMALMLSRPLEGVTEEPLAADTLPGQFVQEDGLPGEMVSAEATPGEMVSEDAALPETQETPQEDGPAAPQEITPAMLAAVPEELRGADETTAAPSEPEPVVGEDPEVTVRLRRTMDEMLQKLDRLDEKIATQAPADSPPEAQG